MFKNRAEQAIVFESAEVPRIIKQKHKRLTGSYYNVQPLLKTSLCQVTLTHYSEIILSKMSKVTELQSLAKRLVLQTISAQCCISCRNQPFHLQCKSNDRFSGISKYSVCNISNIKLAAQQTTTNNLLLIYIIM